MRPILFTAAALAALSTHAYGQTPVSELVVTAPRLATTPELVTGLRTIERDEIEARQATFAADVLNTLPGVSVFRRGVGGLATVRLRGAEADKTLVLIDGVPVNDPADPSGAFDFGALQLADVERVELLSGPQGSLWGSDAIGGVIAFHTRELDGWALEAEAGSYGSVRGALSGGLAADRYAFGGSVAGFRTDGVSKAAVGTEDDAFETVTASAHGRVDLTDAVRLDGRLRYTSAEVEIDGFAPPDFRLADTAAINKSRAWSGFGRVTADGPWGFTHKLSLGLSDLTRTDVSDFPSRFTADREVWRWTAERGGTEDPWAVVAGLERQEIAADLDGRTGADLSTSAAFAVGRARLGPVTATASLRHDDPDAYRSKTTGRLSLAAELGAGFVATASAGQGFKTPTLSQLVCDFCFPAGPALDLKPETAEGYDLRLGWRSDDGAWSAALTGYRLTVKDQIAYVAGRYVNIARTRSEGLEAEATGRLTDQLSLRLAYAHTDAIDMTTDASLLRVPDHSGSASLFWDGDRLSGALTVRGESSQADTDVDGFSRIRRKGFVVADLAGAWKLTDRVSLTGRIENLADTRYQEAYGYREPGRSVFVGVRVSD
ncbi:TonB-dependent receptor plug domain-containing protein [Phenylobacterium terrae]|uniref:TonB-dependent receptor plug domain-containing protein n=1 Tax=Phenylobacterium terrae TaxID=2665495 RepID=A0ABW4MYF6_9CAUL